jgi:multiple sugar transport system substrate-binding protein
MFGRARAGAWRSRPLVADLAAIAVAALVAGCGSSAVPTGSPTPASTASPSPAAEPVTIRWYLGLSFSWAISGLKEVEAFAERFNESQDEVILELVEEPMDPLGVFERMLAAGEPPDIVGPTYASFLYRYDGAYLDLDGEIAKQGYDLSQIDSPLLQLLRLEGRGQIGLPYSVSPGFIFYDKDLFSRAGLPDLPKQVGETYLGKPWDWNTLRDVAALLTLDNKGRTANDPHFDSARIAQWGFDFQGFYELRIASSFGGGSLLAPDGKTAQIPQQWREAWRWYYDAIWARHIAPTGAQKKSLDPEGLGTAASGRIAMAGSFPWQIWAFGGVAASTNDPTPVPAFTQWDMAVMPSWNKVVSSPTEAQAMAVTAGSRHPSEAFRVMTAIMADPQLRASFGEMPADRSARPAYYAARDAEVQKVFPGNTVTWRVLDEMAAHPALPHPEATLLYGPSTYDVFGSFYEDLTSDGDLDVDSRIDALTAALQAAFDNASPGPWASPSPSASPVELPSPEYEESP